MNRVVKPLGNGVIKEPSKGMKTKPAEFDPGAEEALNRLKCSDAIDWLGASPALVDCAKQASEGLFSLTASNFDKAPLRKLYTDRFDAEQIWQQIDLQSLPVLSYIRRRVKILEKVSVDNYFVLPEDLSEQRKKHVQDDDKERETEFANGAHSASEDEDEGKSDGSDEDLDGLEGISGSEEEDDEDEEQGAPKNPVEDDFFKISEMENFLDKADADENGLPSPSGTDGEEDDEDEDDVEAAEAGFSEEDDEDDEEDGGGKELGLGKYEEFFGKDKKRKVKFDLDDRNEVDDSDNEDGSGEGDMISGDKEILLAQEENLSAHEKRLLKAKKRIEYFEKANIDPKDWTQQGEVTAKKRPKNSALEVELDFDHNARPPPVITEEVTASLEDMIKARIAEGRFDDIQRRYVAADTAPKERIELDENKSQKGLGELYEADYMQQTGSAVAPATSNDALRSEATLLFKALCSRLDALSHFNFAPKPVIEDMGVRADVPALAMEEVAPLAVSDASMLAPEEVFTGEDGLKAEAELTPEERKRRRAQKKRKRKGERRTQDQLRARKRVRPSGSTPADPKATPGLKIGYSSFSKSTKVFAALDSAKDGKGKVASRKDEKQLPRASNLKL